MHSLKVRALITVLLGGFGYLILQMFVRSVVPLYADPSQLIEPVRLWSLITLLLIISGWAYALIRSLQGVYSHARYGSVEEQVTRRIRKDMDSLDVFMEVARKEFMKRRISKETFDDIQRIAGKKMVELKAKRKEVQGPRKDK